MVSPYDVAHGGYGLVYLATPYTFHARLGRGRWATEQAVAKAARLAWLGVTAISPIAIAEPMCGANSGLDPLDEEFWSGWCGPLLKRAEAVLVADIPGWHQSAGCCYEAIECLRSGRPLLIEAETAEVWG